MANPSLPTIFQSLKLNGGGSDISGNASSGTGSKETPPTARTPRTPQTPLLSKAPPGSTPEAPPHTCIRQGNCGKAANKHLSTLHESKVSPRTPPVTPDSPSTYLDDDLDSMYSFATTTSGRSTMSCEHPYVAR